MVINAFHVGAALVEILNKMVELGFDPKKLHIVAHSLGAQIASSIGRGVNFNISRITGKTPEILAWIILS